MVFVYGHSATVLPTLQLISKNEHCHTRAINTTTDQRTMWGKRTKTDKFFLGCCLSPRKVTTRTKREIRNKKNNPSIRSFFNVRIFVCAWIHSFHAQTECWGCVVPVELYMLCNSQRKWDVASVSPVVVV